MEELLSQMTPVRWMFFGSFIVSLILLIWLWPICDGCLLRSILAVMAFVPFVGPPMFLMLALWPSSLPYNARDHSSGSSDFTDRWEHVFRIKDPVKRRKKARAMWTVYREPRDSRRQRKATRKKKNRHKDKQSLIRNVLERLAKYLRRRDD